jgi:predicted DNA-binding mobile mystery protein A
MTFEAFGSRLGVSRQNAQQIETAEVSGSITLKRLRAAADALNCDVLVSLVPRQPLEEFVQEQALQAARKQILRTAHSMALESQALTEPQLEALIGRSAREMIERGDARIWIQK